MTHHTIRNVLVTVDKIQSQMSLESVDHAVRSGSGIENLRSAQSGRITKALERINSQLAHQNLTAADLAIRSRRAYQWLCFLADRTSLRKHLDALRRMLTYLSEVRPSARRTSHPLQVSFYHQAALYQVRQRNGRLELKIQEAFITAPDDVLVGLLKLAYRPSQEERRSIKEYTFNQEYQRVRKSLEYLEVPGGSFAAGQAHHLEEIFHRVNQAYFDDQLLKPNLVWSKKLTHRKFGHYQWDTDTVMVSSTLDRPGVPALVLDYVMYHELLHKKMGAKRTKHQRIAHTREFRQAEAEFRNLAQAQKQLNRIARQQARTAR